jgi:aminomethyltransferase
MPVTPLRDAHEALGARFTDFGGWEMPLQYEGVIAEHTAVREGVGVFDVSHLGRFAATGAGATELLRSHLCNDIARVGPGRAQYTMALNLAGGVVDDIIVWRIDDEHYWVIPNGVNFDDVMRPFMITAPDGVTLEGVQDNTVLLAVQGPESAGVIEQVLGVVPGRFRVIHGTYDGGPFWAAGTGYTGERGAEIAVPVAAGESLLRALLEAGATPCGLGARDTLRLEMGYPLWGQDLTEGTTPLEAGLEWVIAWDHDFTGRDALAAEKEKGIRQSLVGFMTEGRTIPRPGHALRCGDSYGSVTSGNFSPILRRGIGMGYLAPPPDASDSIEVEIRGKWHTVDRVDPPFIDR